MSAQIPESARPLLEALLAGDIEVSDPRVVELFETSPEAREEWEALHRFESKLAAQGEADLASLRSAMADRKPMLDLIEQHMPEEPPTNVRSIRAWQWIAAAAVLVFGFWIGPEYVWRAPAKTPDELYLSLQEGAIDVEGEWFVWRIEKHDGHSYLLTFLDRDGREVLTERTEEFSWKPNSDQRRQLEQAVLWRVTVIDGSSTPVSDPVQQRLR